MRAPHYRPEMVVIFHTESGNLIVRGEESSMKDSKIDNDVVSVTTLRDMGADAPTFSIVLTRNKPWHKHICSNDLVSIYMKRPPEGMQRVFVGLVEDCRKKVVMSDTGVQRVISVTGRGVAKAFIQFDTGIVPEAEVATPNVGWLVTDGVTLGGSTASAVLQELWDNICKKFVNYKFDNGNSLFDIIDHYFESRQDLIMLDDTALVSWQGSLWFLIREIAESPFYECYWESNYANGKPQLTVRPTPFDKEKWDNLTRIELTDEDIIMDETGRSDLETYTIFSVGAKSMFSSNDPYKTFGTLPLWYKPYGDKYGIRRLHVESIYTASADEKDTESYCSIMRKLQTDLYNWNIINNNFFNGTIVVKGGNKYQIGCRLLVTSIEDNSTIEYYVTSVKQQFVNFESWVTELGVTRGIKPEDRFKSPVGKSEEYQGLGLVKYDPASAKEWLLHGGNSSLGGTSVYDSEAAKKVVEGAKSYIGVVTYVNSGFDVEAGRMDCSLFTQTVFKKYANIDIGRTTEDQYAKGTDVQNQVDLAPGDLIFFNDPRYSIGNTSHVGIYIGSGQFIHNSSSKSVTINNLGDTYYSQYYKGAKRILQASAGSSATTSATASKLNKVFGGRLAGKGQLYVDMGAKYGIDPGIAAAISMMETGNGSVIPESNNNPGGIMDSSNNWMTLKKYPTLDMGIESHFKNLKWHKSEGRISPEQLKPSYCPDGAANDPNGTNGGWLPGVNSFIEKINNA